MAQKKSPFHIEFHADDFGLFPAQSRRILDCAQGSLNGISILPNSPDLDRCMDLLQDCKPLAVTVHLNLIEGTCLSDPRQVPALADEQGILQASFGKLLLGSFLLGRNALRQQLKQELSRQIHAVSSRLPAGTPLRLDGHAHYHMIPVVFDALMDVLREEKPEVSYIRLPREYIRLYAACWWKLHDYSPINLVKVIILNLLTFRARLCYGQELDQMEQRLFLGVFLSGRMDGKNVSQLLPLAEKLARKKGLDIEILAHPGGVEEPEDIARITNRPDLHFLTSPMRKKEVSLFFMDSMQDEQK